VWRRSASDWPDRGRACLTKQIIKDACRQARPGRFRPDWRGVIGDALLRLPAWVFGAPLSGATRFVVAVIIGMMALATIALAAGFGWHDEIEQEAEKKPKRAPQAEGCRQGR